MSEFLKLTEIPGTTVPQHSTVVADGVLVFDAGSYTRQGASAEVGETLTISNITYHNYFPVYMAYVFNSAETAVNVYFLYLLPDSTVSNERGLAYYGDSDSSGTCSIQGLSPNNSSGVLYDTFDGVDFYVSGIKAFGPLSMNDISFNTDLDGLAYMSLADLLDYAATERIWDETPEPSDHAFFLLDQYNSQTMLKPDGAASNPAYAAMNSGAYLEFFGSSNQSRITCFKVGNLIYFCTLYRNTTTEEILYYCLLKLNDLTYENGAIIPGVWSLDQVHNIYYWAVSCDTILRNMPEYTAANVSAGLNDAYIFLSGVADPYTDKGQTGTGGGGTGGSDSPDTQSTPGDPGLSALSLGLCTAFIPGAAALQQLASFLYSANTSILDELAKLFGDPMSSIIGLQILPVSPAAAGSGHIKLGNIDTGVTSGYTGTQYVDVSFGDVTVTKKFNSYLDYEPYTKTEIYLPYIGIKALDSNDVIGKTVSVNYKVDILSGACIAMITCDGRQLYSFAGNCSQQIPITSLQYNNIISGALTIGSAAGSMIATEGATAAIAIPSIANSAINIASPQVTRSGSLAGNSGQLGIKYPYIIRHTPKLAIPAAQNEFIGYPSLITERIGSLFGYTQFQTVFLAGISATDGEKQELENLMKGGVIL